MLVMSASLEVENGISNLWQCGEGPGFKDYPDYGQYIPMNYFEACVCGFPHLLSPREHWYAENVPWESFVPLVQEFNGKRTDLIKSTYLVLDELKSAWRPKMTKTGGLPNITYEPRKPKSLGTMFKNGVEAVTGCSHVSGCCGDIRGASKQEVRRQSLQPSIGRTNPQACR